jgi:hypothetical protein
MVEPYLAATRRGNPERHCGVHLCSPASTWKSHACDLGYGSMRTCAKMRCGAEPVATVTLGYLEREVVIADLLSERDRNLLDLCREHVDRMTPPIGWTVRDARTDVPSPALAG